MEEDVAGTVAGAVAVAVAGAVASGGGIRYLKLATRRSSSAGLYVSTSGR